MSMTSPVKLESHMGHILVTINTEALEKPLMVRNEALKELLRIAKENERIADAMRGYWKQQQSLAD